MAAGTKSNFQIYEEQFFAGMFEVLEQNVNAFNEASNGAIRLVTDFHRGDFEQESFFKVPSGLISDRNITSTAAVSDTPLTQGEEKAPKTNKKIGPVANTLDSFKKISQDPSIMSFILGQQVAPEIQGAFLGSAMSALVGVYSVAGIASNLVHDATDGSLESVDLIRGMSKFGDAAGRIRLWVMHSKPYFDLMVNQTAAKLLEVTAGVLYEGTPATLGKPVLVTDEPALFSTGSSTASSADDEYFTFGLVGDAVAVKESEDRTIFSEIVTGKENLLLRYQGEFAYTVDVKGATFSGSANPADSALATAGNWSQAAADKRSMPGVAIKSR